MPLRSRRPPRWVAAQRPSALTWRTIPCNWPSSSCTTRCLVITPPVSWRPSPRHQSCGLALAPRTTNWVLSKCSGISARQRTGSSSVSQPGVLPTLCLSPLPGFSGSDVYLKLMEALSREWQRRVEVKVHVRSVFACERQEKQQRFLLTHFGDTEHLFATMEESATLLPSSQTLPCIQSATRGPSRPGSAHAAEGTDPHSIGPVPSPCGLCGVMRYASRGCPLHGLSA